MRDESKTKSQLIEELDELRKEVERLQDESKILADSEKKYKELIENSDEAILVTQDSMIKFMNPATMEYFGYTPEELQSNPFTNFIHPDDRKMVEERHVRRINGENIEPTYSFRLLEKNRNIRWLEVNAILISWEGRPASLSFLRDITQRRKTELDLARSELFHRRLLEEAPIGIFYLDSQGTIIFENPSMRRILGATESEVSPVFGKRVFDLKFIQNSGVVPQLELLLAGLNITDQVLHYSSHLGQEFYVQLFGAPLLNELRKVDGAILIAQDITQARRAEEKLRESESKYRTLVDNAMVGVYRTNMNGEVVFANQALVDMVGYDSIDDVNEVGLINLYVEPDQRKRLLDDVKKFKKIDKQEVVFRKKSLEQITVLLSMVADGSNLSGMVVDITDRKRIEQALQESEERLKILFQFAPDAYFLHDLEGRFLDFNKAAAELLGYKKDEIIGERFMSLNMMHPDDISKAAEVGKKNAEGIAVGPDEYTIIRKDGKEIPVEIVTHPVKIRNKTVVLSIARDVTDRKQAEAQIQKSLREKEVLLKEIHHRVKNNLSTVSGLLGLQSKYLEDEQARNLCKESQNRIMSMARIHEKLYQSDDLGSIDFGRYIRSTTDELLKIYKTDQNNINIHLDVDPITFPIHIAVPCGLIINELVTNSLNHAFPESGENDGIIMISLKSIGQNTIEMRIKDNGMGITEDLDSFESKSLGLRLVKLLAEEQLNGNVEIRNKSGTTFIIQFQSS